MLDGNDLDPYTVLGLTRDAPAEAIREAFRRKSLKYHPDQGGDEWAFRIVLRAYERLTGGGAGAASGEPPRKPAESPAPEAARVVAPPGARWSPVRPGVEDRDLDRARLVQVEVIWVQSEVADVFDILQGRPQDRQRGGSLSLTWPDPDLPIDPRALPHAERVLMALNASFDEIRRRPGTLSARSHIETGRYEAWLQYPSGPAAHDAFKTLRTQLRARGLGVRQWTRILTVPQSDLRS